MKTIKLRILCLLLAALMCLSLAACSKSSGTSDQEPTATNTPTQAPASTPAETESAAAAAATEEPVSGTEPEVESTPVPEVTPGPVSVSLYYKNEPVTSLDLQTATVFQLSAVTSDGSSGGTWTSSDASAASVDENGVVTCWKAGSPRITYTQGGASASVTLNITEPTVRIYWAGGPIGDLTLNNNWGFEIDLTAVVTPEGTPVTWTSDDATVATVSETGHVTGKRMGTTTVHAKCGTATADCIIRITANPPTYAAPTPDVSDGTPRLVIVFWGVPNTDFTLSVGTTVQMNYMLYNVEGDPGVTWSIEDPAYASVDANGVVTGLKPTAQKDPYHPYTTLVATCGELRCECIVRVKAADTTG